ncbi:site-specific integrase [Burkholderia pseudomallei]|uniref:site-specific integrase n=1 Tax=Burkholderia pseudomallei TaxID=28450 RepID=UPI0006868971|nr:site-specific integrase [Burkholderia pseudomallei]MBF3683609.1 site-specific integrase [Burkholderia pseudomallei]MBF4119563.1 site-specific integrase [Burkholderia pseudomallei]
MGKQYEGVRARGNAIQIDFRFEGERCRETVESEPTPANLKKASEFRASILYAIKQRTFKYAEVFPNSARALRAVERGSTMAGVPGDIDTFEKYFEAWLDGYKQQVKASTFEGYRKIVDNILIPKFGRLRLAELKRPLIKDWLKEYAAKHKPTNKRLGNIQSVLRKALHDAVDDEKIELNPMDGWSFTVVEEVKDEDEDDDVDPFPPEDIAAILSKCKEQQERNLFEFAFWTGLRTSELCALQWGNVDWNAGTVRVRRAATRAGRAAHVKEGPKSKAGRRDVKLLPPALAALKAQKPFSFLLEGGDIFLNPRTGKPWSGDQVIRLAWVRVLKLAGVRYRNPYQTRHTFASMMLSAGEHPMWVAKQMGHKDWTMIGRIYGRWMPHANPNAGSKAVELFASESRGFVTGDGDQVVTKGVSNGGN